METSDVLLWAGLILFVVLGGKIIFRTVKVRNISGVVVMGDVKGDVNLTQASEKSAVPAKPPAWEAHLSLLNIILGIVAAVLVIASFMLD